MSISERERLEKYIAKCEEVIDDCPHSNNGYRPTCGVCDKMKREITETHRQLAELVEPAEPDNPVGLVKPTAADLAANRAGRIPDLMHLLAKVAKAERSLTRPVNGIEPTPTDQRSAAALRRLVDAAVRECASDIDAALVIYPGRKETL